MHDTAVGKTSGATDAAPTPDTCHAVLVLYVCMPSADALEIRAICVVHTSIICLPLHLSRHVSKLCPELCFLCDLFGSIECSADRST